MYLGQYVPRSQTEYAKPITTINITIILLYASKESYSHEALAR